MGFGTSIFLRNVRHKNAPTRRGWGKGRYGLGGGNPPGFDRRHDGADGDVLLEVDGSVDGQVPQRRLIVAVDHVQFDVDVGPQRRIATVGGHHTQPELVALPSVARSTVSNTHTHTHTHTRARTHSHTNKTRHTHNEAIHPGRTLSKAEFTGT